MLWIYTRGCESLRVETRFANETAQYVLIVYREDGTQAAERFTDSASFQTRLGALEKQLDLERWQQTDGVKLLRDGWKI